MLNCLEHILNDVNVASEHKELFGAVKSQIERKSTTDLEFVYELDVFVEEYVRTSRKAGNESAIFLIRDANFLDCWRRLWSMVKSGDIYELCALYDGLDSADDFVLLNLLKSASSLRGVQLPNRIESVFVVANTVSSSRAPAEEEIDVYGQLSIDPDDVKTSIRSDQHQSLNRSNQLKQTNPRRQVKPLPYVSVKNRREPIVDHAKQPINLFGNILLRPSHPDRPSSSNLNVSVDRLPTISRTSTARSESMNIFANNLLPSFNSDQSSLQNGANVVVDRIPTTKVSSMTKSVRKRYHDQSKYAIRSMRDELKMESWRSDIKAQEIASKILKKVARDVQSDDGSWDFDIDSEFIEIVYVLDEAAIRYLNVGGQLTIIELKKNLKEDETFTSEVYRLLSQANVGCSVYDASIFSRLIIDATINSIWSLLVKKSNINRKDKHGMAFRQVLKAGSVGSSGWS